MTYAEEIDAIDPNITHFYRDGKKIGQITTFIAGHRLCESVWGHVEVFNYPEAARGFIRSCKAVKKQKRKSDIQRDIITL